MRNPKILGAVAVLVVLVATVAVFGSTNSAQAGLAPCVAPTGVTIEDESSTAGGGIADNTYKVTWAHAGGCGEEIDHYTVVLTVCPSSGGACKTVKFEEPTTELTIAALATMKGVASKSEGDILTASVQAKHLAGKNGHHAKGFTDEGCIIEGARVSNTGPLDNCDT